ncbi:MAG: chitinase [Chthonomonadaceae bacterium]|nr:chitinase [Chthonomonadaceae bacterium]
MSTSIFTLENPGISTVGTILGGTLPWGNRKLTCAGIYTWINTVVTGTDCYLPSYYVGGASDIVVTISNVDGTGVSTTTLTASAGSYQNNVDLPIFTGRGGGTDAQTWVRIRLAGSGNDLLDADALLKVTALGTPALALPVNFGPITVVGALPSHVGIEGGYTASSVNGYSVIKSAIGGYFVNSTKIRFKAMCATISILVYNNDTNWHINRLTADGSSGIPLDPGHSVIDAGTNQFENWITVATGLDPGTEALYEITGANPGSTLFAAIMTSGGTGINTGASGLIRSLKFVGLGDSRMVGLLGTNGSSPGRVDLGVMERLSQHYNCQVVNGGINGSRVTDWNASGTWNLLSNLPSGSPVGVVFDFGINDVFNGETVADFSAAYSTGLTTARSKLPGVAFLVEGIKPTTFGGQTFSSLHQYNVGNGTTGMGVQGIVEALTADGDTLLIYVDTESWQLAGPAWNAGGSFDPTNYSSDQLHENPTGQAADAAHLYSTLTALLDTTPPTIPEGLAQIFGTFVAITLKWTAATDPDNSSSGLVYKVYRDGGLIATTPAGVTSFVEAAMADGSTHTYAVQAQDSLGNQSAVSSLLSVVYSVPAVGGGGGNRLSIGLA